LQIDHCEFPDDALYDLENNTWIKTVSASRARVGITSVYAALAGRINVIKLKPTGTCLQAGQSLATIESARYFGVVRTPILCTLAAVNSRLKSEPKVANDFPYDLGWFAEITWASDKTNLDSLIRPEKAVEKIQEQIRSLHVRCFAAFPDYEMWEVGVECAAVLVRLNELLERCKVNDIVHVVSDDPTADIEMERWVDESGQAILESRKEGNLVHFIVKKVK
jgi:glycine cleavage system H lipoate-binding protein/TusA-related sulfurtransferase